MNAIAPDTAPRVRIRHASSIDLSALAATLNESLAAAHPRDRLRELRNAIAGRIVFTTSLGLEDQVILHLLADAGIDSDIVTLDTGRLFPQTYSLWSETERRYGISIRPIYPKHDDLEALVARQGIDGFYNSVEARLACCQVRKVEPLNRALAGAAAWITGLRADQSHHRSDVAFAGIDTGRGLLKASPLFDWSRDNVVAFARQNGVPLNPLHDAGFASIGCAPCTRALKPGEPERAGRWWWENENKKECGLHLNGSRRAAVAADGSVAP